MSRRTKIYWILVLLLFLTGIVYVVKETFRQADEAAELSCLSSIAAVVDKAHRAGEIHFEAGTTREFTKEEVDTFLKRNQVGDCGRVKYVFDQVHIAIGNVNRVSPSQIRVWTNGGDGISGTSDDLIIPWGENHPN